MVQEMNQSMLSMEKRLSEQEIQSNPLVIKETPFDFILLNLTVWIY